MQSQFDSDRSLQIKVLLMNYKPHKQMFSELVTAGCKLTKEEFYGMGGLSKKIKFYEDYLRDNQSIKQVTE